MPSLIASHGSSPETILRMVRGPLISPLAVATPPRAMKPTDVCSQDEARPDHPRSASVMVRTRRARSGGGADERTEVGAASLLRYVPDVSVATPSRAATRRGAWPLRLRGSLHLGCQSETARAARFRHRRLEMARHDVTRGDLSRRLPYGSATDATTERIVAASKGLASTPRNPCWAY